MASTPTAKEYQEIGDRLAERMGQNESDPKKARRKALKFLREAGILTKDNKLTERYSAGQPVEQERVVAFVQMLGVKVPDPGEVLRYLRERPGLVDTVEETARLIGDAISSVPDEVVLTVNTDREIDDPYLVFLVRTMDYTETFFERLEALQVRCPVPEPSSNGWILVTTDFKDPGERR